MTAVRGWVVAVVALAAGGGLLSQLELRSTGHAVGAGDEPEGPWIHYGAVVPADPLTDDDLWAPIEKRWADADRPCSFGSGLEIQRYMDCEADRPAREIHGFWFSRSAKSIPQASTLFNLDDREARFSEPGSLVTYIREEVIEPQLQADPIGGSSLAPRVYLCYGYVVPRKYPDCKYLDTAGFEIPEFDHSARLFPAHKLAVGGHETDAVLGLDGDSLLWASDTGIAPETPLIFEVERAGGEGISDRFALVSGAEVSTASDASEWLYGQRDDLSAGSGLFVGVGEGGRDSRACVSLRWLRFAYFRSVTVVDEDGAERPRLAAVTVEEETHGGARVCAAAGIVGGQGVAVLKCESPIRTVESLELRIPIFVDGPLDVDDEPEDAPAPEAPEPGRFDAMLQRANEAGAVAPPPVAKMIAGTGEVFEIEPSEEQLDRVLELADAAAPPMGLVRKLAAINEKQVSATKPKVQIRLQRKLARAIKKSVDGCLAKWAEYDGWCYKAFSHQDPPAKTKGLAGRVARAQLTVLIWEAVYAASAAEPGDTPP